MFQFRYQHLEHFTSSSQKFWSFETLRFSYCPMPSVFKKLHVVTRMHFAISKKPQKV